MNYRNKLLSLVAVFAVIFSTQVFAVTSIKILGSKYSNENIPVAKITKLIEQNFNVEAYREVKAQIIYNYRLQPDHILVYLFSKKYHQVKIACIMVDKNFNKIAIIINYQLKKDDFIQQPGIAINQARCPDQSVEFIAFAPNDMELEQDITKDVANAAKKHGLKTIILLKEEATRANYLNFMKCPQLKGNFYDGDANPEVITTVDGIISYDDINTELRDQFQYKVTNIWLACEAYNDPIKSAVIDIAQTQKYAAGINDLLVGPSDEAAACAMKAALDGEPMTASFEACYKKYDTEEDKWGFGGKGSDIFSK